MGIYAEVNIFGDCNLDIQSNKKKNDNLHSKKRKLEDNAVKANTKKPKIEESQSKVIAKSLNDKVTTQQKSSSKSVIPNQMTNFKIPKLSDKSKSIAESSKKPESKNENIKERSSSKQDEKTVKSETESVSNVRDVAVNSKDLKKETSSLKPKSEKSLSSNSKDIKEKSEKRQQKESSSNKPREEIKKSSSSSKTKSSSEKTAKPELKIDIPSKSKDKQSNEKHSKKPEKQSLKKSEEKAKKSSSTLKDEKCKVESEKPKKIINNATAEAKPESSKVESKQVKASKPVQEITKSESQNVVKSVSEEQQEKDSKPAVEAPKILEAPKPEIKVALPKVPRTTPVTSGKLLNFMKMYEQMMHHDEEFSSSEEEEDTEDEVEQVVEAPKEKIILKINTSAIKAQEIPEPMEVEEICTPVKQEEPTIIQTAPIIEVLKPVTLTVDSNLSETAVFVEEIKNFEENVTYPKPIKQRIEHRRSLNDKPADVPKMNQQIPSQNQQRRMQPSRHSLGEIHEIRRAKQVAQSQLFGNPRQFDVNELTDQWSRNVDAKLVEFSEFLNSHRRSIQTPDEFDEIPLHVQFINSREGYFASKPIVQNPNRMPQNQHPKVVQHQPIVAQQTNSIPKIEKFEANQQQMQSKFNPIVNNQQPAAKIATFESIPQNQQFMQNKQSIPKTETFKANPQHQNMQSKFNAGPVNMHNQQRLVNKDRPVIRPAIVPTQPLAKPFNRPPIRPIQPFVRASNQIQPPPRPANMMQPFVRPSNQTQPPPRPANMMQPFVRPSNQTQPPPRPANMMQPFVKAGNQIQLIDLPTKPVKQNIRPAKQNNRPEKQPTAAKPVNQRQTKAPTKSQQNKFINQVQLPTNSMIQPVTSAIAVNQIQPPSIQSDEIQKQTIQKQNLERLKEVFSLKKTKKEPVKKNSNQKRLINIGRIKTAYRKQNKAIIQQKQQQVQVKKQSPIQNQFLETLSDCDASPTLPQMTKQVEVPQLPKKEVSQQTLNSVQAPVSFDDLDVSDDEEEPTSLSDLDVSDDEQAPVLLNDLDVSDSDSSDSEDSDSSNSSDSDSSDSSDSEEETSENASKIENLLWGN